MTRNFSYSVRTVISTFVGEKSRTNRHRNGRQVRKAHAPFLSRAVGGVKNVGKRQFAVRCRVQVWRFDAENDDDVRDAVVADIVDEMEKVTTETPAQEAEENEVEVNEVTASPPSLAQLYAMFRLFQESAFLCTCPMRVVIFRELCICLERRFASQTQPHGGKCSLRKCFRNVLKSFL